MLGRELADTTRELIEPLLEDGAAFRRIDRAGREFALPKDVDQGPHSREHCIEPARAPLADKIIGIESIRKERELEAVAGPQVGQRRFHGPERRAASGGVAVEAQDRLRGHAPEQRDLFLGESGAERRDRLGKAGLRERDDVHVALDDEDLVLVVGGLAGVVGVEQNSALVEERGLRRVQVLGRCVRVQRATAEGDDPALGVRDREHDAVAEAVVGDRDIVAADQHAGRDHVGGCEARLGEMVLECGAAVWCVAQAEAGDGLRG